MNTLARGWDLIVGGWYILCGITASTDAKIKRFANACLIILLINISLFILGFFFSFDGAVILATASTSLGVLIVWKLGDVILKIMSPLGEKIPIVGSSIKPAVTELRSFLTPFVLVSLILAFVGSLVAIRGVGYYDYQDLIIWSTIGLFGGIFCIYIDAKFKIAGWVIMIFLTCSMFANYIWPIQVQGALDWVERGTIRKAITATDETKNEELVVIANNVPLYSFSWGKFKKEKTTTQTETTAKVIGRKDDPRTKEPMFEVIMPVAENLYVGGESMFVPVRMTKPVIIVAQQTKDVNEIAVSDKPLKVYYKGTHHFTLNEGEESGWIRIPPNMSWGLSTEEKDPALELIKFEGDVLEYSKEKKQYATFPDQDMLFKLRAKEKLRFTLWVNPSKKNT